MSLCVQDLINQHKQLEPISQSSYLDTLLLIEKALNQSRNALLAWPENSVDNNQVLAFESLFKRRIQGEPIAYLLGEQEFWSLPFFVNSDTLIPRPDTELMIELACDLFEKKSCINMIDVGTGSGAIALALASERPHWSIIASDICQKALCVANKNKQALQKNITLLQANHLQSIADDIFDLIISNPPYIDVHDPHLLDLSYEPKKALISSEQGFYDLKLIIKQAKHCLKDKGYLLLEHGNTQAALVRKILEDNGFLSVVTHQDLAGLDRVTLGRKSC